MLSTRLAFRSSIRIGHNQSIPLQQRHLSQLVHIPLIFTGLLITLWTWKSFTLILFQNKIIYMPYLGRRETLADHPTPGVTWQRDRFETQDGIEIISLHSRIKASPRSVSDSQSLQSTTLGRVQTTEKKRQIKILYLQGNASSPPPRLRALSKILFAASRHIPDAEIEIIVLSYRGYWESSGRPSEAGLLQDVRDCITRLLRTYGKEDVELVIWGHSIGASLALLSLQHIYASCAQDSRLCVKVILETPFDGIASVLRALYPQRWLPYRYLSPFLRTRLDVHHGLDLLVANTTPQQKQRLAAMPVMLIKAEKDEIVPAEVSNQVILALEQSGVGKVTQAVVRGGLHQDCLFKPEMHSLVIEFVRSRLR